MRKTNLSSTFTNEICLHCNGTGKEPRKEEASERKPMKVGELLSKLSRYKEALENLKTIIHTPEESRSFLPGNLQSAAKIIDTALDEEEKLSDCSLHHNIVNGVCTRCNVPFSKAFSIKCTPAPQEEKCKNCGWKHEGLCTDNTKGCMCGFKGNSYEVSCHECPARKEKELRCKTSPNCSHNTNGRSLDKPCSIEWKDQQKPQECEHKWHEEFCERRANRQRNKNPLRWNARQKLRNALYQGKIKKELCKKCGAEKVQGHHTDYSKPLDVVWLCSPCHKKVHAMPMKSTQNWIK